MKAHITTKKVKENAVEESVYCGVGSDYIQGFLSDITIEDALLCALSRITDTKELLSALFCLSVDMVQNGIDIEDLKDRFDSHFDTYGPICDFAANLTLEVFQYIKSEFTNFMYYVSDYENMLIDFSSVYEEIANKLADQVIDQLADKLAEILNTD